MISWFKNNKNNNEDSKPKYPHKGMQIHEVQPVIFGGDPVDPQNKVFLTRQQHAEIVTWWNYKLREVKNEIKK